MWPFKKHKPKRKEIMTIRVDIDNTICQTPDMDYRNAVPLYHRIERINNLFNSGHTIIYWTSRGVGSGKNYRDLTLKQLQLWGCKFHKLETNKPIFDLFIDDKVINANDYFYDNV